MTWATLALMSTLCVGGQVPSDVVTLKCRSIDIPVNFDPSVIGEIREVLLFVSTDQGRTWQQGAVTTPHKPKFTYEAPADGLYWFGIMVIDRNGQRDPPNLNEVPPARKILIDTQAPRVTIRSVERRGSDIAVVWEVQDSYIDYTSIKLEYREPTRETWTAVQLPAIGTNTAGTFRFPGPASAALQVRLSILDLAGNRGEEVRSVGDTAAFVTRGSTEVQPAVTMNSTNNSLSGAGFVAPPTLSGGSPVLNPAALEPTSPTRIQPTLNSPTPPTITEARTQEAIPLAVSGGATKSPTHGEPAMTAPASAPSSIGSIPIIRETRFDLNFEVEDAGPSGISRAELWVTRDDGRTWQRWPSPDCKQSPFPVELETRSNPQLEGNYGFKIVLYSGAGLSKGPPMPGDVPDARVEVDLTAPIVRIYEPLPDARQRDVLILRWQAEDKNLPRECISLDWSDGPDGPWQPIAGPKRIANSGSYPWKLPTLASPRVYLRITAHDAAGNFAEARTPQPILVDLQKPSARIQGIVTANGSKPPR